MNQTAAAGYGLAKTGQDNQFALGNKSLANCTRAVCKPKQWAKLVASKVLPTPGWSSMSKCPLANKQTKAKFTALALPKISEFICDWALSRV